MDFGPTNLYVPLPPAGGQDIPGPARLQYAVPLLGHQHLVHHGQVAEPIGGELLLQRDAVDRVNDAPSGVFDVEVGVDRGGEPALPGLQRAGREAGEGRVGYGAPRR